MRFIYLSLIVLIISCSSPSDKFVVSVVSNSQTDFAVAELKESLVDIIPVSRTSTKSVQTGVLIEIDKAMKKESYTIVGKEGLYQIKAADNNAVIYALQDLGENIRSKGLTTEIDINEEPYVGYRGLKFNIPLDIRTPSYDDTGDNAQNNIAVMWEEDFWIEFLDQMARNRYNLLTLWSTHPYPSWVKLDKYPEVALEDIYRFGGEMSQFTHMKWKGESVYDHLELVKEMTIDEKIAFWKRIFQHAQDRGIDIYLFHWNVFVHGAEGKHGITWEQDNPITVDYIKESVKSMLLTYPNIKGIGVTAGEHVNRKLTGKYKTENWMWLTYGRAIMEAKEVNPDLDVRFIFRRHWSDLGDIRTSFKDFDSEIETSFKYSRARMYSSDSPPWFDNIYREDVEQQKVNCWLNIRNDDYFTFRWGDPEYASRYIKNLPIDVSPGFYIGPDGYVQGREFVSKKPTIARQLEVDKHWYKFMIWGRAAYNPGLSKDFYLARLKERFPDADTELLYDKWKLTSSVISLVDKLHFRQNDGQFAPEGSFDRKKFHDINSFISTPPMPEQNVVSIPSYLKNGRGDGALDPEVIADSLLSVGSSLVEASQIDAVGNVELAETLSDLACWGYLSSYYGYKFKSALSLAKYQLLGDSEEKKASMKLMEEAVNAWETYAELASSKYEPQLYARTQKLDWVALIDSVKQDLMIIKSAKPGEPVEQLGDNYLWNRDKRRF